MNPLSSTLIDELNHQLGPNRVLENHVLAPFTTFQIGGPADAYFEAQTANEFSAAIKVARKLEVPFFILGLGANILVSDKGFRGLVIRNRAGNMSFSDDGILTVESGAIVWPDVIQFSISCGYAGLEHYAGIPSTIGGALWQNLHFLSPAPARERTMFIDEVFLDALILDPQNARREVGHDYFNFGYDQSVLHHSGDIVLSARFQLEKGVESILRRTVEENLQWRSERHPPLDTEPSAGSIFKKIDGIGAGRLIDECGFKGERIGGIEITRRHANIMINRGGGTAAEVMSMIERVQTRVKKQTGYELEPEIAFVGEF